MEPDGQKTDSQGAFPGATSPGASGIWASLFHGMLSKACGDHFPGLLGPALTPPVLLKVSAGRRMRTVSAPPSASLSPPSRRRRHPELLRFGAEA